MNIQRFDARTCHKEAPLTKDYQEDGVGAEVCARSHRGAPRLEIRNQEEVDTQENLIHRSEKCQYLQEVYLRYKYDTIAMLGRWGHSISIQQSFRHPQYACVRARLEVQFGAPYVTGSLPSPAMRTPTPKRVGSIGLCLAQF